MKTITFFILLCGLLGVARAQNPIYPSVPFDEAAAAAQLEPGTGELAGYAIAKEKDKKVYQIANLSKGHRARRGTLITVFPVTPYFEEYLKLRKKHGGRAQISPEAYAYRIIIATNDEGEFYIPGLKPGRYYLEAEVGYYQKTERAVQTGTSHLMNGDNQIISSQPIYTTVSGGYNASRLAFAFAEIKTEGGQAIVKLTNG